HRQQKQGKRETKNNRPRQSSPRTIRRFQFARECRKRRQRRIRCERRVRTVNGPPRKFRMLEEYLFLVMTAAPNDQPTQRQRRRGRRRLKTKSRRRHRDRSRIDACFRPRRKRVGLI